MLGGAGRMPPPPLGVHDEDPRPAAGLGAPRVVGSAAARMGDAARLRAQLRVAEQRIDELERELRAAPRGGAAPAPAPGGFPDGLGPFAVQSVPPAGMEVVGKPPSTDDGGMYRRSLPRELRGTALDVDGAGGCYGALSPSHDVTLPAAAREAAHIPASAATFVWAYPPAGAADLDAGGPQVDPGTADGGFLLLGGFVYMSAAGAVVAVNAIGRGAGLAFKPPAAFPGAGIPLLHKAGRLQDITIDALRAAGARRYCWLRPGEAVPGAGDGSQWADGGFIYLFGEDGEHDHRDRFFAICKEGSCRRRPGRRVLFEAFGFAGTAPGSLRRRAWSTNAGGGARELGSPGPDVQTCVVCMDQSRDCLFVPCSHFATCRGCAAKCAECPICRAAVTGRMQVFPA